MDPFGVYHEPMLPLRLMLASCGRPGDSGALVRDVGVAPNTAVGFYMGEYTNAAGQTGGLAQNAEQVTQIMDMELFT